MDPASSVPLSAIIRSQISAIIKAKDIKFCVVIYINHTLMKLILNPIRFGRNEIIIMYEIINVVKGL